MGLKTEERDKLEKCVDPRFGIVRNVSVVRSEDENMAGLSLGLHLLKLLLKDSDKSRAEQGQDRRSE